MLYHLGLEWIPGGFLGVDIFFVISGFLITTLLLSEVHRTGRIGFGAFYLRRARRLLPALFLVLAVTMVLAATIATDVAAQVMRDIPAALLYVSNWWSIGQEQSYFELIGRGNMLAHLWSLAVEEQFYLVWPAIVGGVCWAAVQTRFSRRRAVGLVAVGGALLSTAWMAYLSSTRGYPLDADPTRVYFGTDTHAMSVMVGAALASVWRPLAYRVRLAIGGTVVLSAIGLVALGLTVMLLANVDEYMPWLYRGGFLVAALVFALLVAAATHPASPIGTALDVAPMRWVGERSYGIYLWHWPIFLVTRPGEDLPWVGPWVDVTRVALVLLVAEASYRWVETPVRHGALGRWAAGLRTQARTDGIASALLPSSPRAIASLVVVTVAIAALVASLSLAPSATQVAAPEALGTATEISDSETAPTSAPTSATPSASASKTASAVSPSASASASTKPTPTKSSAKPAYTGDLAAGVSPADRPLAAGSTLTTADISWFGDSVTLWAADVLRQQLPGVSLDAGLNRSPGFIQDRVLSAEQRGRLRRGVVMHLGDAGPVSGDRLEATLSALSGHERIVLINSTARFAWVPSSNRTLREIALAHPNVVVADWKTFSHGHTDWFVDGLHLSAKGKPHFAAFVRTAMLGS